MQTRKKAISTLCSERPELSSAKPGPDGFASTTRSLMASDSVGVPSRFRLRETASRCGGRPSTLASPSADHPQQTARAGFPHYREFMIGKNRQRYARSAWASLIVDTGHLPSWLQIAIRIWCSSSSQTLSTVPALPSVRITALATTPQGGAVVTCGARTR